MFRFPSGIPLIALVFLVLIIVVFGKFLTKTQVNKLENSLPTCKKEENCCVANQDCKYIWFTGACNTPEYVARVQKEAEEKGRRDGEAPPRKNVTCTCESRKCITHN